MSRVSVRHALILGVFLMILSALYMVPLGFYSPCVKEKGALGPPPALIGHRGAPMVRNPPMKETVRHESASVWKTINAAGELLGLLTFSVLCIRVTHDTYVAHTTDSRGSEKDNQEINTNKT